MAPHNPDIGIIGKGVLNDHEKDVLFQIGRLIVRLGHRVVLVPSKGVADVLREGVKAEGGEALELESGVVERANHTLIYPDKRLLSRLLAVYPNLESRSDVAVIEESQLDEWLTAVKSICDERGITTAM